MASELDRRGVLRLLAGGIGIGLLPLSALAQDESDPTYGDVQSLLNPNTILPHWESAVAIGNQVVAERRDMRDLDNLLDLLEIDDSTFATADESELARLRERLQQVHKLDFREGRTVSVGGWFLSLTEQRLAAVVALLAREGRFGRELQRALRSGRVTRRKP